ncbi:hypothetical protein O181_107390 [Austropuccinia psidii MF-1]|uniref:Uncharacterized protein n=1 Tax=Austropuccinia psidii MF-1 TaxID=1389203 RepID=A0A9Q3JQE3_9BASI|nr:hypothetical protein [Austropuccinia psidii MF-1]
MFWWYLGYTIGLCYFGCDACALVLSHRLAESLSTGNNRDIPVSVQELVYGSKAARLGISPKSLDRHHELISSSAEVHGSRKDNRTPEGLDTNKKLAQGKENSPVEAPQASTSAKQAQANPKTQSEGQTKGKGKSKAQIEQAIPTELQESQERGYIPGQCVQYGKNSDGTQKQGGRKIEPIFCKEIDLLKLVNQIETCNKEIITNLKTF